MIRADSVNLDHIGRSAPKSGDPGRDYNEVLGLSPFPFGQDLLDHLEEVIGRNNVRNRVATNAPHESEFPQDRFVFRNRDNRGLGPVLREHLSGHPRVGDHSNGGRSHVSRDSGGRELNALDD